MAESKQKQQKTLSDLESKEVKKEEKDMLVKVKCHSNGALSKKLGAYFNDSHFHDVVLKLPGGQEYKAHRLVLCVWSKYFKEKLQGPSRSRAPKMLDLPNLSDGECEAFEHVLRFMYTGEVQPKDENVLDICQLAKRMAPGPGKTAPGSRSQKCDLLSPGPRPLNGRLVETTFNILPPPVYYRYVVRDLRRLCEEWIGSNIGDHNFVGASARLRDAEKLNLLHLTEKCREIFCHYFTRLPESTWTSLSVEHVEEILKSPEIVVEDEFHLLQKLESWVTSNGGVEAQTEALVGRLLPQIRCRFMSASQLKQIREGKMGDLFKKLPGGNVLEDAFEFRAMEGEESRARSRKESLNQASDDSESYLQPRLYYNFEFVGTQSRSGGPFKSVYINAYNAETLSMLVFNNDGHCWSSNQRWRYEVKAFQDTPASKADPYRLKFILNSTNRTAKSYHATFIIKESKSSGQQLGAASNDPEIMVLVCKGELVQEENSDSTKKITLVTPPIFEKSPSQVELCFVGNCFRN